MANHLERLVGEWLEFKGYFVRRNVRVGKLVRGGWEGELDVVAFEPKSRHVLHIEPSIDASSWQAREERFKKKFNAGKKFIAKEIFPWLDRETPIEQWAVLWGSDKNVQTVGGGKVVPMWDFYQKVARDIYAVGKPDQNAIPEDFPLLRTMQYTIWWVSVDNDIASNDLTSRSRPTR